MALVRAGLVATAAFAGTMVDNLVAFSGQLLLTERARHRRVVRAQALGVACLVGLAVGVGSALSAVPLRLVGLLALAPAALAWEAWRSRSRPPRDQFRRGATTTFLVTLALGGDNLAVWVPLLRAAGVARGTFTVAVFAAWEVVFLVLALGLARRQGTIALAQRWAPRLTPWLYAALAVVVLVECHTLG